MIKLNPDVASVTGFRAAGVHAGLKKDGALDFALIASDSDCAAAGVFTRNKVKAAPVLLGMEVLESNSQAIRAVAVNTISANACTGAEGLANARAMAEMVAGRLDVAPEQVLVMSTGVIGTHLPMDKIQHGADIAADALGNHWRDAAAAMMTTDTRPKFASVTVESPQGTYSLAGVVKGAGMIAPNMATMLSVIVTDAGLAPSDAQRALTAATQRSYNRIVVDGDTSTNDTVYLLCNGRSGVEIADDDGLSHFQAALNQLAQHLAQAVVRDGEGVTKFVTLNIINAESEAAAERIGQTIGASVLTKSAFYGSDANWGRIVAAAGRAEAPFDPDRSSLWVDSRGDHVDVRARSLDLPQRNTDRLSGRRCGGDHVGALDMLHAGLRHGTGQRHHLDLRYQPRLYQYQRRLSLIILRVPMPAVLVLEDGSVFPGDGFGAEGLHTGEIVFNTSMTGYQEILTDPSYYQQIVTMTVPHVGNTGINQEDLESSRVWVSGFVVRALSPIVSNWRNRGDLGSYLRDHGIIGISGVATRALARHIREQGVMRAAIAHGEPAEDIAALIKTAREAMDMSGANLVDHVTTREAYDWTASSDPRWYGQHLGLRTEPLVIAYDYGIKHNILRMLTDRGLRVKVVPARIRRRAKSWLCIRPACSSATDLAIRPRSITPSNTLAAYWATCRYSASVWAIRFWRWHWAGAPKRCDSDIAAETSRSRIWRRARWRSPRTIMASRFRPIAI